MSAPALDRDPPAALAAGLAGGAASAWSEPESPASPSGLAPVITVAGLALLIDFAADVPGRGPFFGISEHPVQITVALIAALLLAVMALPLLPRLPPGLVQLALRLAPAATAIDAFFWTRSHVPP